MTTPAATPSATSQATTLGDVLDYRVALSPDREALVFPGTRWSYRELAERSSFFAKALVGLGVRRGDRVAMFMGNTADFLAMFFAIAKVGCVPVPVNSRFKTTEVQHVLRHSGSSALVTQNGAGDEEFMKVLADTLPDLAEADGRYDGFPELKAVVALGGDATPGLVGEPGLADLGGGVSDAQVAALQASVRVREMGLLLYTSGTTAMPKGVILSHESVTRSMAQALGRRIGVTDSDRVWTPMPFFHTMGLALAVGAIQQGATFVHPGYYEPALALDQLESERITAAMPTFDLIWLPMLRHDSFGSRDLSRIRLVYVLSVEERSREMAAAFPNAKQIGAYGSTEAFCYLATHSPDDPEDKRLSTGGRPLEGVEVRVIDPGTGVVVPPSTLGELVYRSPMMFDGYYQNEELTKEVVDAEGFFRTGDLVTLDADGYLTFVSRLKDMLKVGGENVAAAEVEGFLVGHPAVRVAAVVAAPDAYYQEVPAAYLELEPGAELTEQDVIDYCVGKIANFRVPRYVRFVSEWPMSGTKIKKYELREQIAAELRERGITEAPRMPSRRRTPGLSQAH